MKLYRVYYRGQVLATTYAMNGWDAILNVLLGGVYLLTDIEAHEVRAQEA